MTTTKVPAKTPRKRTQKTADAIQVTLADGGLAASASHEDGADTAEQASSPVMVCAADDEAVVQRVEHLNHSVGWVLISAGIIGLVVPGVLGTPFLIMGGLALWPGNHKRVERWRQGHSPKRFHGAMKQINRFLDDLEKRYPRIEKQ